MKRWLLFVRGLHSSWLMARKEFRSLNSRQWLLGPLKFCLWDADRTWGDSRVSDSGGEVSALTSGETEGGSHSQAKPWVEWKEIWGKELINQITILLQDRIGSSPGLPFSQERVKVTASVQEYQQSQVPAVQTFRLPHKPIPFASKLRQPICARPPDHPPPPASRPIVWLYITRRELALEGTQYAPPRRQRKMPIGPSAYG